MTLAAELAHKHQRVIDYLDSADLDGVLLGRRCNFSWATCGAHNYVAHVGELGNSFLLIDRQRIRAIANNIETPRLESDELAGLPIEVVSFDYSDGSALGKALEALIGSARVAADCSIAGVDLAKLDGAFDRLRWQLTDGEIDRYEMLCSDVVRAVEAAARAAKPGQTENAIAGLVAAELRGNDCLPWVLLVGADERLARYRHPLPTNTPAERAFMIAVCAERGGLISACSRVVSFGAVDQEMLDRHVACATVDAAIWSRTRVGETLGDIFAEAVEAYEVTGFADQWRLHHQGGSIGYQPREVKASPDNPTVVLANQPFAWNPSITGTKSEDTILCRADGPTLLAEPTDWPTVSVEWKGFATDRPAILAR
jgi:Xaa-Pro aminopeptidase